MQRLCVILIGILGIVFLNAQAPYFHFEEFTPAEARLHSGIVEVYQDHLGYIWFTGFDGVTRYDGHEFTSLEEIYPKTKDIEIKSFRSIHVDAEYSIWLGSLGSGVIRISKNGDVIDFDSLIIKGEKLPSKSVRDVFPIKDLVWVYGDFGLRVYQETHEGYKSVTLDQSVKLKEVTAIYTFDEMSVWMSDNKAIYRYDLENERIKKYAAFERSKVNQAYDGSIWINKRASGNFLYRYDSDQDSFFINDSQPFASVNKNLTMTWNAQNQIWASAFNTQIYMGDLNSGELVVTNSDQHNLGFPQFSRRPFLDHSGAIWIVNASAYKLPYSCGFDPLRFTITNDKIINGFHLDQDYVVMSVQGEGLILINKKSGEQKVFNQENSDLAKNHVSFVRKIGQGVYAIGLVNYLQVFDVEKGFVRTIRTKGIVRSFFEDDEYFWVGGLLDLLRISKIDFSRKHIAVETLNGNLRNSIHQILPKDKNTLWLFGAQNGVQLYDKITGELTSIPTITNTKGASRKLSKVVDADVSEDGTTIAVATESGLFMYSVNSKKLNAFDLEKQLMYATKFQNDSIVWATTNSELVRCNCYTLHCDTYGREYGLINSVFRNRSKFMSPDGVIFFGGDKGLDRVPLEDIKANPFEPKLQVREAYINRKERILIEENSIIKIPPTTKLLELNVDAMHYSNGDKVKIEYKYLRDKNWNLLEYGDQ
ncbi:MAG: hypothetical protein AAGA77_16585, partial [Bacteroidota bacterium]